MLCSPTKTERPRDVKVPASALAALRAHRKRQDEFRKKFGPAYRADLDLIFANPDGTALRPNSVSSVVSLLFRRLNLPKGASLHSLRHSHEMCIRDSPCIGPAELRQAGQRIESSGRVRAALGLRI